MSVGPMRLYVQSALSYEKHGIECKNTSSHELETNIIRILELRTEGYSAPRFNFQCFDRPIRLGGIEATHCVGARIFKIGAEGGCWPSLLIRTGLFFFARFIRDELPNVFPSFGHDAVDFHEGESI